MEILKFQKMGSQNVIKTNSGKSSRLLRNVPVLKSDADLHKK